MITRSGVSIHRIVEQSNPVFDPRSFFPGLTDELFDQERSAHADEWIDSATGLLNLPIQSYVVQTPHHTVLIDTCVGNHKERPTRPFWNKRNDATWLKNLAEAGFEPADFDYVLCTHLHVDHVGWNTTLKDGRWIPTFPRARYVFSRLEAAYWADQHATHPVAPYADSVLPIIEAQRADMVEDDHAIGDHLRFKPTPGHTPHHVAVEIGRERAEAVMTGDLIHSPLQLRHPGLTMMADVDPAQAVATRRSFLDCHCETGALLCTAHFPSPSVGYLERSGPGYRLIAAE